MSDIAVPQSFMERLDYFSKLNYPGWDSYNSNPVTEQAIKAARCFPNKLIVTPTSMGGVCVEYDVPGFTMSVQFGEDGSVCGAGFYLEGDPRGDWHECDLTGGTSSCHSNPHADAVRADLGN